MEPLPVFLRANCQKLAIALLAVPCLCAAAIAEPAGLTVELNKLEPQGTGCRAYLVVNNESTTPVPGAEARPRPVPARRRHRTPVRHRPRAAQAPSKRAVKLFDLDGVACDKIGSFLINEVVECKTDAGPVNDCLAGITVKSLTSVQLTK